MIWNIDMTHVRLTATRKDKVGYHYEYFVSVNTYFLEHAQYSQQRKLKQGMHAR